MSWLGRLLLGGLLAVVLSSCQARSTVDVDVAPNGSGSIEVELRLDEEAAAVAPKLSEQLRTADLTQAGWQIDGPDVDSGGDTVITATKDFDDTEEANRALGQIGDAFRDFRIVEDRGFLRSAFGFQGTVDLSEGIDSLGDEQLRAAVGSAVGFDSQEMQRSLDKDWAASFPVEVAVHLPGDVQEVVPSRSQDDSWHPEYGKVTGLTVRSSSINTVPLSFFALALLTLLSTIVLAITWKSDIYRPQHRKKRGSVRARDLLRSED